ncbi:hypothetical protein CO058_04050 [candidate division WWE3 bacterium CG_4_9_14_0_2_um_filter_35_11]|uniref:Urease accessory protein UreH-like transmembrane domain-containing protein n=1 Tax=candidate division WWE3 bacterium CG_4_9_14_0_2_um_filter_35_11 TaxID=1975077 RepID=A0A2M8EKQ1_UNCKA|nr:MAG: hypothetical protein COV25_03515 [candidate division WWE3 bacterium CG10_big_fil_rev_8_21_14_0_10_35_32]PJC23308.1 MAG: hypothetical protein CO058_04050 [candidate division WWE3 bacterium CG_4_9_14_0_2_um_filter_35_11]
MCGFLHKIFILLLFLPLVFHEKVYADPPDNTDSYLYILNESDGGRLNDNVIKSYTYINWFQSALLVEKFNGVQAQDIQELLNYQTVYNDYVKDHLIISNSGKVCEEIVDESPVTEDQISLSLGTRIIITYKCEDPIENVTVNNTLFNIEFETGINYLNISNGENTLFQTEFNREKTEYVFAFSDESKPKITPNESRKDVKKIGILSKFKDLLFLKSDQIKNESLGVMLIFVFVLGALHTLEAGHSKAILASAMLHKKMSFRRGIAYAVIFTATHIGDIIIMGIIFAVANNFFQFYAKFTQLGTSAGYVLLVTAIWILIKNTLDYRHNKSHEHGHEHTHGHMYEHVHTHELKTDVSFKEQLFLGFITGIAPCLFGWSIFMLVVSTGKMWNLVPVILSFGLGIFSALSLTVFLISKLKNKTYGRFEKLAEISPILSGVFLLIYAIITVL